MVRRRLLQLSTGLEDLSPGRFILLVAVIGGVLLWWIAVRRRRFSVWKTALQVMLALDLADALALLLSIAMLSLDVREHLLSTLVQQPLSTSLGELVPPYVVVSAIRFVGAAVLVAIGRRLPGSGQPIAEQRGPMPVASSV